MYKRQAQDVAVGTVVDVAIAKVGKYLTNTSMADSMKNYLKGTKWGNKIFKSDRYYRSQITRARNAWKNKKIIKPRFRTYMNGFLGVSGMELIDKVTEICKANGVKRLDLFGSFATGTATDTSDVDFVVYRCKLTDYK